MRTFKATCSEQIQVKGMFIRQIPGLISSRIFSLAAAEDPQFAFLEKSLSALVGQLNDAFISKEQHLELVHLILYNREFLILRDTREGNAYFETFFEEVK